MFHLELLLSVCAFSLKDQLNRCISKLLQTHVLYSKIIANYNEAGDCLSKSITKSPFKYPFQMVFQVRGCTIIKKL